MNTLKEYIQENLVITNKEAEELGYTRHNLSELTKSGQLERLRPGLYQICLLYTSDAADDGESVDLGGRRIIKKKKT